MGGFGWRSCYSSPGLEHLLQLPGKVSLFSFSLPCISLSFINRISFNYQEICLSLPFLFSVFFQRQHVKSCIFEMQDTLCYPKQTKARTKSTLQILAPFYVPSVFLCFSQLYFSDYVKCISQIFSTVFL